jgi:hypothetical protein
VVVPALDGVMTQGGTAMLRLALAVALLLASVGTASAECAWVLWAQRTDIPDRRPEQLSVIGVEQGWRVIGAQGSEGAGKRDIAQLVERERRLLQQGTARCLYHRLALSPRHHRPARAEGEMTYGFPGEKLVTKM